MLYNHFHMKKLIFLFFVIFLKPLWSNTSIELFMFNSYLTHKDQILSDILHSTDDLLYSHLENEDFKNLIGNMKYCIFTQPNFKEILIPLLDIWDHTTEDSFYLTCSLPNEKSFDWGNAAVGGCFMLAGGLLMIIPGPSRWVAIYLIQSGADRIIDDVVQMGKENGKTKWENFKELMGD